MLSKFKFATKGLSYLCNQFPFDNKAMTQTDRMCNCINLYCNNGIKAIEQMCNLFQDAECSAEKDPAKHNWITLHISTGKPAITEIRWCKNCGCIDIVHCTNKYDALNHHNLTFSSIGEALYKEEMRKEGNRHE